MEYDIIVIGGGPAGMMAAIRAGESGSKAVLIEKNHKLGVKLLLTGGGRCNLTHLEKDGRSFCSKFGREGDFLLSPFSVFGVKETMEFFRNNGIELMFEDGKVYPVSEKSKDVLNVLISLLKKNKVEVITSFGVEDIKKDGNHISSVVLSNGKELKAKKYIICTGGKSYPITGSTGEGLLWAKRLGHSVKELKPALTPIETKEEWTKSLPGISLKDVSVSLIVNGKAANEERGEILFTHFGLSGPLILDKSREMGDLMEKGKVKIIIDLLPGKDLDESDKYLRKVFEKNRNKHLFKCLSDILPEKLCSFIMNFSGVSLDKKPNYLTKEERKRMVKFMKKIELSVVGLLGFDKAMVTRGGISLKEIDSKAMKSKIVDNLYFAGEVIDLDGPSGGYNLQLCWTTGYVAGQSAQSNVK